MKEESGGKKDDQFWEIRFICKTENLVFDSLIYLEPVERFKNWSYVMEFRIFGVLVFRSSSFIIKLILESIFLKTNCNSVYSLKAYNNDFTSYSFFNLLMRSI